MNDAITIKYNIADYDNYSFNSSRRINVSGKSTLENDVNIEIRNVNNQDNHNDSISDIQFKSGNYGEFYKSTNSGTNWYIVDKSDLNNRFELKTNIDLVPKEYSLEQNYPNPFNPVTKFKFSIPVSGIVVLKIFDATGREVTELVNKSMQAGTYEADWDASVFSSGIYFYTIISGDFALTRKMVLIK